MLRRLQQTHLPLPRQILRVIDLRSSTATGDSSQEGGELMSTHEITRTRPRITGAHEIIAKPNVEVRQETNEVSIIVTQVFGPKGDNLVGISDETFDGYPAVTLLVRSGESEGLVHLSPIHGDERKTCTVQFAEGTRCELLCPVSKQPLPKVEDVPEEGDTEYYALYLTPQLSRGSMVMVSNVWGHYHSRIIDDFELISSWVPEPTQA